MKYAELIENESALPQIVIKRITKDMRFIFIGGEKAGSLHLGWDSEFQGFNTWRKVHVWTGEFTFRGKTIHVGRTAQISEMLPKITRLVRRAALQQ